MTRTPVAVFSDHDINTFTDVTTLLDAVTRFAPDGLQLRIYAPAAFDVNTETCFRTAVWQIGRRSRSNRRLTVPNMARLAREVRAQNARIVHIATDGVMGCAGRWLAGRLRLPLVASCQAPPVSAAIDPSLRARMRIGYVRWLYDPCHFVLVPSRAVAASLQSLGRPGARLRRWTRGVDAAAFDPAFASKSVRARWHVDHRHPAIACIADTHGDRILSLLPAIERLLYRHAVAHQFVVLGHGRWTRALVEKCPAAVVLKSPAPHELAIVMASADVALSLAATDPIGSGVLEAQASGLPVVATDDGDAQEAVQEGAAGVISSECRPESIARALVSLLSQPKRRREMSLAARAFAAGRPWPAALEPFFRAWRVASLGSDQSPAHHLPNVLPTQPTRSMTSLS
jgi:glycosyltransferase involved in cell wall biosynthesis